MPVRAISFDLDDTLWDTGPVMEQTEIRFHDWLRQHYPRVAQRYDVAALHRLRAQLAAAEPARAWDFTHLRRRLFRQLARESGYAEAEFGARAWEIYIEARHDVRFFDDVLPVLERLAERFTLVALSNGNAEIARVGLDRLFRFGLCAREVGRPKPHPAIYRQACKRLGLAPADMVHVGDHPEHDVLGAARAGLATVWLNRDGRPWPAEMAVRPDAVIPHLHALPPLLRDGGAGLRHGDG